MPRKPKTIHYIYKTTCNVTNRFYIGMHSTNNLNDGYMGSGRRLRASIRKHGEDNHTKEILECYDTRELLIEAEKKAITGDMVDDRDCMNLKGGGEGGFISDEQQLRRSKAANKALNDKLTNDPEFRENWLTNMKIGVQKAMDTGKMKTWKDNYSWEGRTLTDEHKRKIGETNSIKQKGKNNSQYGTCWITKEGSNKKIKKEDLEQHIKDGWLKGRK